MLRACAGCQGLSFALHWTECLTNEKRLSQIHKTFLVKWVSNLTDFNFRRMFSFITISSGLLMVYLWGQWGNTKILRLRFHFSCLCPKRGRLWFYLQIILPTEGASGGLLHYHITIFLSPFPDCFHIYRMGLFKIKMLHFLWSRICSESECTFFGVSGVFSN